MPRTRTSWRKGQSGNPGGRPKLGDSLSEAIRARGTADKRQKVADKAWEMAMSGVLGWAEFIADRTEGKPPQRQIIEGGERPLLIRKDRGDSDAGSV